MARTYQVSIRFSEEERALIAEAAEADKRTAADYIRLAVIERATDWMDERANRNGGAP